MSSFEELAKIDCSPYVEKKGKFTYLSWPFAFAELFKRYPKAEIDVREWDGFPAVRGPKGWMVSVAVNIDGVKRTQWHPVLDNNNRTIAEPDVFQFNTSIQRAAVKAIALHGLGLYIYAGEDLPEGAEKPDAGDADQPRASDRVSPLDGVWDAQDAETQAFLLKLAAEVVARVANDPMDAAEYLALQDLDTDSKAALWSRLDSKIRTPLTKAINQRKAAA